MEQQVRFQTAASLLPAQHIMEFKDMIRDPPEEAYNELFAALKSWLGKSTE